MIYNWVVATRPSGSWTLPPLSRTTTAFRPLPWRMDPEFGGGFFIYKICRKRNHTRSFTRHWWREATAIFIQIPPGPNEAFPVQYKYNQQYSTQESTSARTMSEKEWKWGGNGKVDLSQALARRSQQAHLKEKGWNLLGWHHQCLQVLVQVMENKTHGLPQLAPPWVEGIDVVLYSSKWLKQQTPVKIKTEEFMMHSTGQMKQQHLWKNFSRYISYCLLYWNTLRTKWKLHQSRHHVIWLMPWSTFYNVNGNIVWISNGILSLFSFSFDIKKCDQVKNANYLQCSFLTCCTW